MASTLARGTRQTALIMSASRLTRSVLAELISEFDGYGTVVVDDLPSLFRTLRQDRPELIFVDAAETMLTLSETIRMVRADETVTPSTRLIALSPPIVRAQLVALKEAGTDACLGVPLVPQRVFRLLSRYSALPKAA